MAPQLIYDCLTSVLPTALNVCSYTTLAKKIVNFHMFNNQYLFYFDRMFLF